MPLTIVTSPRYADHVMPPGHPERVERFEVMRAVAAECRARGVPVLQPRPALEEELRRVHDRDHVARLKATAGRAVSIDADTFTSPQTYDVACLAAGAGVVAVETVLAGPRGSRAAALVRPPGHHAERDRAMGFCLFNNVAVAAAHARAHGVGKVAIVDFDVHHGNGTQWSFYDDPSVLFISSHQYPFYPGTGAAGDVGSGPGKGFTVNLPLEAGATDADVEFAYARVALPVLRQFAPDLILVSAGFDAFVDDPLGGCRVTAPYFGRLTHAIAEVADACCEGRMVAITEGGYDLQGLAACLRATLRALAGEWTPAEAPAPSGPALRGEATVRAVRPQLAPYWTL